MQTANPDITGWALVGGWPLYTDNALDRDLPERPKVCSMDPLPLPLQYVKAGQVQVLVGQPYYGWGYESVKLIMNKVHGGKSPEGAMVTAAVRHRHVRERGGVREEVADVATQVNAEPVEQPPPRPLSARALRFWDDGARRSAGDADLAVELRDGAPEPGEVEPRGQRAGRDAFHGVAEDVLDEPEKEGEAAAAPVVVVDPGKQETSCSADLPSCSMRTW